MILRKEKPQQLIEMKQVHQIKTPAGTVSYRTSKAPGPHILCCVLSRAFVDMIAKSVSPKPRPMKESNVFGGKAIKIKDVLIKQLDCSHCIRTRKGSYGKILSPSVIYLP